MPGTEVALPEISTSVSPEEALKLRELAEGKTVLELGAWLGFSAATMCQTALKVHTVDHFQGDDQAGPSPGIELFRANTAHLDNLIVHIGRFEDILPMFPAKYFEFCFLDGYHSAEATRWAAGWARRLTHGQLAFHDYGLFGVTEVVDELGPKEVVGTLAIV